jgi:hypothetical protein
VILTVVMAHQRKLIRQAVVALLTSANTDAGTRVKSTRVDPHKRTQLPAIGVYTLDETTDSQSAGFAPIELTRHLQLEITAWVEHSDEVPLDDSMDDIAEQIENAMASDYYLSGTVADQMLESTMMQVVEDDGRSDPLIGIVVLTYAITYRTYPLEVGAEPSDAFVTVDVKQPLVGGVPTTVPAEDKFTVQEAP